ncbi:tRNA (adenine(37)-N6)-methyltransferase isoform X2 [Stegostoma tigrinum]|nr:tRNA (adenine(37)-N6)-methyltransferase isoform X2 [Stegostoma tigrinum]XP_059499853.1 tRNA (adenine(37)-N6)-methyltransferase isoform X2 [Stegostoma tigrinum]
MKNRDDSVPLSLEKGSIQTVPIGYIESCFMAKNGTPRQPTICSLSRARLKISKTIFNNPEHSLMGLDQFSHVWIIFVFHKNGHQSFKAKVKPPRLNGLKTGVFSTRSPHRPNAIGLTLAKLDRIEGDTVYLSGIDMIQGTPVLDIKPYIPEYDAPRGAPPRNNGQLHQEILMPNEECQDTTIPITGVVTTQSENKKPGHGKVASGTADAFYNGWVQPAPRDASYPVRKMDDNLTGEDRYPVQAGATVSTCTMDESTDKQQCCIPELKAEKFDVLAGKEDASYENILLAVEKIKCQLVHNDALNKIIARDKVFCLDSEQLSAAMVCQNKQQNDEDAINIPGNQLSNSTVATWIKQSPVPSLQVRFTPHAELDLEQFQAPGGADPNKVSLKYFQSVKEAKSAIEAVLAADPRSVYRRKQCQDTLFYFTVDVAHITTWFGDDFAEILRIKPVKQNA